jgi:oxidase EvaA
MKSKAIATEFLRSALSLDNAFMNTGDVLSWLEDKKNAVHHKIEGIPFSDMEHWSFEKGSSNLRHQSGKYFSIEGVQIDTNWGRVKRWSQPIINQPEIGILGIITKKFGDILHFLMQAKIEPGNINTVQLSPTLQATKSNYTMVHGGKRPNYFEYFEENKAGVRVLLDQLQSEQGARFLKKRNRNVIIEVEGDIEVREEFCWLTLGQIKQLLEYEHVVNMDTRTVISGIPLGNDNKDAVAVDQALSLVRAEGSEYGYGLLKSAIDHHAGLNSVEDIISWITRLKSKYELDVRRVALNSLDQWIIDDYSISHKLGKYFSVIAIRAEIGNREVKSWTQPLVKSAQDGIIAFIIKKINGVYHFLVQAKLEAGNFDIIELAPTVQCLTGNYRKGLNEYEPDFLDFVLQADQNKAGILYSVMQSEEGGRFFREQNRNIIVEAPADFDENLPENFIWMTLGQLQLFIKFNNYLNIQARSLISAVRFI